tara:strand:+ start:1591 stop:2025 length:435 start_codon:yes stop_codon:yes gene_type:complete
MKTKTVISYVLRLPRKGNFAPIKLGCREAKFIRTKMPQGLPDMWIANGKIYTDVDEFNEVCDRVTPSAYKFKLQAFAYVFSTEVEIEVPSLPKPPAPAPTPPPVVEEKKEEVVETPPVVESPPLPTPTAKKAAKKATKKSAKKK